MDEYGNTETSYFDISAEPKEQKVERMKEENKAKAGKQLLEDVLARLDKRITFYDTVKSIEVDVTTKPEEHLRAVLVAKGIAENLKQERDYWQTVYNSVN